MTEESSYRGVFKTTFIFGSVQAFTIVLNVLKNKVLAILLGTNGVGIIGLYLSSFDFIQSFTGLGINQSSVRYVAETNNSDLEKQSKIITITIRLLWFTGLLGTLVTIIFSKTLSNFTFGNDKYALTYILLSSVVFLNILNAGQNAILQGKRMVKALAKASIYGAITGLISSVPFYYFCGDKGIAPSLIISAFSAVLISSFYLRGHISSQRISIKETINGSIGIIKLGLSLMLMTLMVSGVGLILRSFISHYGDVNQVGVFQAGYTIITSYFGMVFIAMTKDYFPRLSAVSNDNDKIISEVNHQAEIGLLIIGPLIVLMLFACPFIIQLLYTKDFLDSVSYINFAVFGVIFQVGSQTMGLILIAKNRSDVYVKTVFFLQTAFLLNNLLLFHFGGLAGLGLSFAINMIIDFTCIQIILSTLYNIRFSKHFYSLLITTLLFCLIAYFIKEIDLLWVRMSLGGILFFVCTFYSLRKLMTLMGFFSIMELLETIKKRGK